MMDKQLSEKILNYKNAVASKYLPVRSDQILKEYLIWKNIFYLLRLMVKYALS